MDMGIVMDLQVNWRDIAGLFGVFLFLFVVLSLVSYTPVDPPASSSSGVSNWAGRFGAHLSHYLYLFLGYVAWIPVAILGWISLRLFWPHQYEHSLAQSTLGWVLMLIGASGLVSFLSGASGHRNIIGTYLVDRLSPFLGSAGVLLAFLFLIAVGFAVYVNRSLSEKIKDFGNMLEGLGQRGRDLGNWVKSRWDRLWEIIVQTWQDHSPTINRSTATATAQASSTSTETPETSTPPSTSSQKSGSPGEGSGGQQKSDDQELSRNSGDQDSDEAEEEEEDTDGKSIANVEINRDDNDSEDETQEQPDAPDQSGAIEVRQDRPSVDEADLSGYQLPSKDLLASGKADSMAPDDETLKEMSERLEKTFEEFGIDASVSAVSPGPVLTTYEIEP
ncbi:MAG: DNA translocase FtsK 4TM domain-containing protein, partial [bacterium]